MKHTKKIIISLLVLVMGLATLTACGGAPSYVTNPPEDPANLVESLEKDGWKITTNSTALGITTVSAIKYDKDLTTVKEDDKITAESVSVVYYADETAAKAAKTATEGILKAANEIKPSGISFSYKVTQKGKTVSTYTKTSGKYSDI